MGDMADDAYDMALNEIIDEDYIDELQVVYYTSIVRQTKLATLYNTPKGLLWLPNSCHLIVDSECIEVEPFVTLKYFKEKSPFGDYSALET